MPSFHSFAILLAAVMITDLTNGNPITSVSIPLVTITITAPPEPPTQIPNTTTSSRHCDYAYCDTEGTSWCFFFVPFTTLDPTKGPLPGETRTSIGLCGPSATVSTVVDE
ncbi:hypothetical protein B0T10DRAFT_59870 [Thelonectria olida]|uniref:Uncharacterized protein n=1 Tax=Thelonectria olida TaxID=1576542 RepID=A0A9P8W3H6_9HYPO|nr:hypothetical protein B0T10DRAFT_59870 [Thelonectria olida]